MSLPRPSGAERAGTAHFERTTSPVMHGFRESYERGKAERFAEKTLGATTSAVPPSSKRTH